MLKHVALLPTGPLWIACKATFQNRVQRVELRPFPRSLQFPRFQTALFGTQVPVVIFFSSFEGRHPTLQGLVACPPA